MVKIITLLLLLTSAALAGDPKFWGNYPPEVHQWFGSVMQPGWENQTGNTGHSCCGVADAFEARVTGEDELGQIVVVIDDGKTLIPDGTEIHVSKERIQTAYGNPVGKLVIFINLSSMFVYCLVPTWGG